jgi:hypothetical protein
MHMYLQVSLIMFALGLFTWRVVASKRFSTATPLPQGPPGDPIIGHVRVVPTSRPELSYAKWGGEFSKSLALRTLFDCLTIS